MILKENSNAANDNSRRQPLEYPIAAGEVFKAVQAGLAPERLYWKVVDFLIALARAGLRWERSAPLRRLDNLLCRHELGIQPLAGERVAILVGEWLAEHCLEISSGLDDAARAG